MNDESPGSEQPEVVGRQGSDHGIAQDTPNERNNAKQNLIAVLVLLVGIVLAAVVVMTGPDVEVGVEQPRIVAVQTMQVSSGTVQMTVQSRGSVAPKTESDLVAEVAGRIVDVSPSLVVGGFFEKGDILARIEAADYEAGLEAASAQLVSAESELANAERYFDRQQELAVADSISQSQYDEAFNRFTIAQAALREATVQKAQAGRDLERTRLIAPYHGRIRSERVDVGQFVQRGETLASLYSIESAEVLLPIRDADLAYLPLSLADNVKSGMKTSKVLLRAGFAGQDHEWEGSIVRSEGELDATSRMVNLIAHIDEPYQQSNESPLVAGLFVDATIYGFEHADIVVLPRSAVQTNGSVYVVNAENRLEERAIDVLRIADDKVYIRNGLRDGETVCITVLRDVLVGQTVRPISDTPLAPTS